MNDGQRTKSQPNETIANETTASQTTAAEGAAPDTSEATGSAEPSRIHLTGASISLGLTLWAAVASAVLIWRTWAGPTHGISLAITLATAALLAWSLWSWRARASIWGLLPHLGLAALMIGGRVNLLLGIGALVAAGYAWARLNEERQAQRKQAQKK